MHAVIIVNMLCVNVSIPSRINYPHTHIVQRTGQCKHSDVNSLYCTVLFILGRIQRSVCTLCDL